MESIKFPQPRTVALDCSRRLQVSFLVAGSASTDRQRQKQFYPPVLFSIASNFSFRSTPHR